MLSSSSIQSFNWLVL